VKDKKARDAIRQLNREQIEIRQCPNCGHRTPQVPTGFVTDEFNRTTQANRYDCLTCGCRLSFGHISHQDSNRLTEMLQKALDISERAITVCEAAVDRLETVEADVAKLKAKRTQGKAAA
jgi:Zn ribbon nucleic-acid-binding protein